jgi:riboflavin transport system permease protein
MNRQAFKSSSLAFVSGVLISAIILLIQTKNPATAIADFLTGSFTSVYYFGLMLNTAALFATAGAGEAVALKSGNLNIGGEGQIYAGGFITAILLVHITGIPVPVAIFTAIVAAAGISAVLALFSALLREFKGVNILLTSFLISAASIPFIDSLIAGTFRDKTGNLLATPAIPESERFLPILPPSPLTLIIIIAPLICILTWYIVYKTAGGRHLRIWGIAPEFARYCGYSEHKTVCLSLAVSGALHGLTGFLAVCGTYYTCHSGFYKNMGWNALSCALIAHSNPLAVIPASLILSWLFTSADRVALTQNLGFDISSFLQGIMLFCISINFIARRRRT